MWELTTLINAGTKHIIAALKVEGEMVRMNKKVLILSLTEKNDYALAEWRKNGVDTDLTLKDFNKLLRGIRRLWIRFGFPLESIWYGGWKRSFMEYDMVIVHGTWMAERTPRWMRRKCKKYNKNPKIVWWYWNSVTDLDHPERVQNEDAEKWSFDPKDCEKYGMKYNSQYYFKSFCSDILNLTQISKDVYYLGSNGPRSAQVFSFCEAARKQGMLLDINVLEQDESKRENKYQEYYIHKPLNYQENLKHIAGAKAILEILRPGQSGQTLRSLEALFHKKKLITNNVEITKESYYHPDNVFVLGKEDVCELKGFLEKPWREIEDAVVEEYDCKKWLERF